MNQFDRCNNRVKFKRKDFASSNREYERFEEQSEEV